MERTPKSLGYEMQAEWEKHSAVWLAWPYDKISFGSLNEKDECMNDERLEKVEERFLEIINVLHKSEKVKILVLNNEVEDKIKEKFISKKINIDKIIFFQVDYADVWLRDYGPIFLFNKENKEQAWLKWKYDAYGSKFPDLLKDNDVFFKLKDKIKKKMFEIDFVLEGGSVESNGDGICITTEECLIKKSRNKEKNKDKIEGILKNNFGVEKVIWLKNGLINDHTDGHVDDIARFVNKNTILCAYEEDKNDPNFEILEENFNILKNVADQNEKKFNVLKIPMPHLYYNNGEKVPASYVNFYIGNDIVLVPTFNDKNDEKAIEIIKSCFREREIVGIDCRDIIYGGGALHCITQQEPE